MKAIIRGKRYDTAKATLIGETAARYVSVNDFHYWKAGLYVTPRGGQYFLAGEGGPMTRWAKHVGNGERTGGEGIVPLDKDQALEWAERYLWTAEVEKHFGAVVQDA